MKKLSNNEAELEKSVAYKKTVYYKTFFACFTRHMVNFANDNLCFE